ncbi:MAG TPA: type VII secretion integral membrane protein EccD [Amycolatopsis sp.]|nr:type VII secretion integral membrane protein EccD [Amycolatopsis sp.]
MEERTQHRTSAPARLRFVLGNMGTDVALPSEVPLVDLLPAVLPQFGAEWVEQGADHEGWVVQRLGEPPLDEDRTSTELNLLDGETLYLRPRADQFSPVDFDDLVDGVAERIREDPGSWTPARTRWMLSLGAAAALLATLAVLLARGPAAVKAAIAGSMALALLCGAAVLARAARELVAAVALAGVAACYAAAAGWFFVLASDPSATSAIAFTSAAAATLAALCLGLAAIADAAGLFAATMIFVLMLVVFGLIASLSPASPPQAASIALVVSLIAGMFIPVTAFRLGGLTLPLLPTNADELRDDIDPVPHRLVVERGAVTVGYAKALHVGLGLSQVLLVLTLVAGGGTFPLILAATVGLLLFLRVRHLNVVVQRWSMLVPAGCAILADLMYLTNELAFADRLLVLWFPALVVGAGLVVLSMRLPGRRLRPYWGRAVDILESLTAVAVLPLVLAVLNVYELMRGLGG